MPQEGGNPSQNGDRESRPRSLEEQLASVVEQGETPIHIVPKHGGDGVYLFQNPTSVDATHSRRRRRRSHASRRLVSSADGSYRASLRDDVANLDRVVVGFSSTPQQTFRVSPVAIRLGEHARSPFVVSLRGVSFFSNEHHEEDRVMESDLVRHEVRSEKVPDLETFEAIASDLHINAMEAQACEDQFTKIASVHRPALFSRVSHVSRGIARAIRSVFTRITILTEPKPRKLAPVPEYIADDIDDDFDGEPRIQIHYIRSLGFVSLLILIAMLPANLIKMYRELSVKREAVASAGGDAIGALSGMGNVDISSSVSSLKEASARFREADDVLSQTNVVAVGLAHILPSTRKSYQTARALLEIGSKSADAGRLLATGLTAALSGSGKSPLERVGVLSAYADGALPLLEDATNALKNVDSSVIPESERKTFNELSVLIEDGRFAIREFIGMGNLLSTILGKDGERRYLVLFQNPSELRATGGFLGSYAELDVNQGRIVRLNIPGGGTYDLQGDLIAQVIPPKPLQLVSDRWEFQDSNWSPDFPTASKKIQYFWQKSGGYSVDGVIAVNASIVVDLLALTGPIDVPELGKTITSENFMVETQKAVELEYDKAENKPKKILGLLAPELMKKLLALSKEDQMKALIVLSQSLEKKDIQIALNDESEEKIIEQLGWNGRLKSVEGDALAVIGSNVAGQKTNGVVEEDVVHRADIDASGAITDSVSVKRAHTGTKGDIFTGVRNVEYFRFYIPKGSTIVFASGFEDPDEMYFDKPREDAVMDPDLALQQSTEVVSSFGVTQWDEGDRTVIGGWSMVDPGETKTLTVSYRLPFSAFDLRSRIGSSVPNSSEEARSAYSLLLTSQSGVSRFIESSVHAPKEWNVLWNYSGESLEGSWIGDRVLSVLYQSSSVTP